MNQTIDQFENELNRMKTRIEELELMMYCFFISLFKGFLLLQKQCKKNFCNYFIVFAVLIIIYLPLICQVVI